MRCCLPVTLLSLLLLAGGCPPENYSSLLAPTLEDADAIASDTTLAPWERRRQLVALGLPSDAIDLLMHAERLANQGGGDLRTAYDKIVAGRFSTLAPDEIQMWGDAASSVDDADELDVELTDDEAQDIALLFQRQNLDTSDELEAYLGSDAVLQPGIPEDVLPALFIDFDPALVLPQLP